MPRVAVTGGAGFLGSHIVKRLIDEGREVSIIDDLFLPLATAQPPRGARVLGCVAGVDLGADGRE